MRHAPRHGWVAPAICLAFAPLATRAQSPTPTATTVPSSESAESLSAQRSKIYQAGIAYSRWLDRIAQNNGSEFLKGRVLDRVNWMLACVASLAVLGALTGSFFGFVRRRPGAIESNEFY